MPDAECYVGIDASLRATGIALVGPDGNLSLSGVLKPPAKMRGAERLLWLRDEILQWLPTVPAVTMIEDYAMGAKGKTFHIGEWGGVLRLLLLERGNTSVLLASPQSVKQYATGNGGAQKQTMMARARHLYGAIPMDDNEADAMHLARMAYDYDRRTPLEGRHAKGLSGITVYLPKPYPAAPRVARKRSR